MHAFVVQYVHLFIGQSSPILEIYAITAKSYNGLLGEEFFLIPNDAEYNYWASLGSRILQGVGQAVLEFLVG